MDLDNVLGKAYKMTMNEKIEEYKLEKNATKSQNELLSLAMYIVLGSLFFSKFKKNVYKILEENNKRSED